MEKLNIPQNARFSELDLEAFRDLKYSVYVIDHNWNYLFVNDYVERNLGDRGKDLVGKNMWQSFVELASDPAFLRMKMEIEKGLPVNFITNSPITSQRLNIVGYPLADCYLFYTSQLPKKEDLMHELRSVMEKK